MQEHAAPHQFRGAYPLSMRIRTTYLPRRVKFKMLEMSQPLQLLTATHPKNVDHKPSILYIPKYIDTAQYPIPRLCMRIYSPELQVATQSKVTLDPLDFNELKHLFPNFCTCGCKQRGYEQILEGATDEAMMYANCKINLVAAVKRQVKSAPCPSQKDAMEFIKFSKGVINKYIRPHLVNFGYSINQWYNHLTRSKQKLIEPIEEFFNGTSDQYEHYTNLYDLLNNHRFNKWLTYEALLKIELQKSDGKPRLVCSTPQINKYVLGPIAWKLEEIMSKFMPGYCGGKNLTQMSDEINNHIDNGFTSVAEGDGSGFDNTQDVYLKEIDRYIYSLIRRHIYHVPREVYDYISTMLYKPMTVVYYNKGGSKEVLMKYYVLGTVFSGDVDTTLMNTVRMALYNLFVNYKAGLKFNRDYIVFSKGDDFSVMYQNYINEDKIRSAYNRYFLAKHKLKTGDENIDQRQFGLGQIMKFLDIGDPTTFKFCSLRSWETDPITHHITLTRDPEKFFNLSCYSRKIKSMDCYEAAQYMYDQAEALLVSYKGIAIFDKMADIYVARGNKYLEQYVNNANKTKHKHKLKFGQDRKTRPLVDTAIDLMFFNQQPREQWYNLEQNYWETVKQYERVTTQLLKSNEALIVNLAISREFDDNLLGQKVGLDYKQNILPKKLEFDRSKQIISLVDDKDKFKNTIGYKPIMKFENANILEWAEGVDL